INALETEINEKVIMLITKQQPIATDLRLMMAALKIASDFERIGDNAAYIAEIRLRAKITDEYVLTRLNTMGKLALLMLKDVDDLYKNIVNTTYLIDNDPFVAGQAHLAARHLERIGDHISNVAESIFYFVTGERYESYD